MRSIVSEHRIARRAFALACVALALTAAFALAVQPSSESTSLPISDVSMPSATSGEESASLAASETASLMADMTLEEKVAQMFIVKPEDITGVDTLV